MFFLARPRPQLRRRRSEAWTPMLSQLSPLRRPIVLAGKKRSRLIRIYSLSVYVSHVVQFARDTAQRIGHERDRKDWTRITFRANARLLAEALAARGHLAGRCPGTSSVQGI